MEPCTMVGRSFGGNRIPATYGENPALGRLRVLLSHKFRPRPNVHVRSAAAPSGRGDDQANTERAVMSLRRNFLRCLPRPPIRSRHVSFIDGVGEKAW